MEKDGFSSITFETLDVEAMSSDNTGNSGNLIKTSKTQLYSASKTKCFNTFKDLLDHVLDQQATQQGNTNNTFSNHLEARLHFGRLCHSYCDFAIFLLLWTKEQGVY